MRNVAIAVLAFSCAVPAEALAQRYCESLFREGSWTVSADEFRYVIYYPAFYNMSDRPYVTFEGGNGDEVWRLVTPFFGDDPKPQVEVVVMNDATGEIKTTTLRDTHGESEFISIPLEKAGFPMGMGAQSVSVSVDGDEVATLDIDFDGFGHAYRLGKSFTEREKARKKSGACKSSGGGLW